MTGKRKQFYVIVRPYRASTGGVTWEVAHRLDPMHAMALAHTSEISGMPAGHVFSVPARTSSEATATVVAWLAFGRPGHLPVAQLTPDKNGDSSS